MSCSCTFAPDTIVATPDRTRHVNFALGMVLGVEDYNQEFAYHSGRDRWIMRELGGYGTLSGLAVAIEDAGTDGPRLRVTGGTAASPGGQLICVGADQCAMLNAWLNRAEIAAKVAALDALQPPPANDAVLKLWLTLCYDSCAIAPVPIPGQPCRSEEDLMAPSRVADDYRLSLGFEPPTPGEADYLRLLGAFAAGLPVAGGAAPGSAALRTLLDRVRRQARILFHPLAVAADAADAATIDVHPTVRPQVMAELRRLWVSELRPAIMPPPCAAAGAVLDDCVPLALLTVGVVNDGTSWQVKNAGSGAFEVDLDQSSRPILMSLALAASPFGIAPEADAGVPASVEYLTASGNISAAAGLVLVRAAAPATPLTATIVGGGAGSPQRKLYLRNAGTAEATLQANNSGLIDGAATRPLAPGEHLLLVYDGVGSWSVASGRK
ncbi:MAG: hypothetical protein ABIT04_09815 [Novosphingobium sp.]